MIAATHSNHPLAGVHAPKTVDPLADALARIRKAGMRVTKPRVALIESLARRQAPVAIETLHHELTVQKCDLVTVYRCLGAFEKIGIVRRSFRHNGTSMYELVLSQQPKHYHIVCKSCGATEPVDYFPIEGVERVLRERGYSELTHLVEFFGVCPACQQTAATNRVARIVAPTRET
ncbi:MAG: transcriptional repressor [Candidatus Didemnitutus sp.]|nr:transcriptional repressor [Candidatus Didemnitutus sp.]